jgi:hypothetical protein
MQQGVSNLGSRENRCPSGASRLRTLSVPRKISYRKRLGSHGPLLSRTRCYRALGSRLLPLTGRPTPPRWTDDRTACGEHAADAVADRDLGAGDLRGGGCRASGPLAFDRTSVGGTTRLWRWSRVTASHQVSRSRPVLRTAGMGHEERFPPARLSTAVGSERRRSPECAAAGEMRRKRPSAYAESNWRSRPQAGIWFSGTLSTWRSDHSRIEISRTDRALARNLFAIERFECGNATIGANGQFVVGRCSRV